MAAVTESNLRNSIKAILQGADLNSLSSKKVRKQLEDEYDTDLTHRKKEIDNMLMEMITASQNEKNKTSNEEESEKSSASDNEESGSESEDRKDDESDDVSGKSSDSEDSVKPPPKKKQKTPQKSKSSVKSLEKSTNSSQSNDSEVDDEALARKLHDEEVKSRSRAVKKSTGNKRESKGASRGTKQKKENSYTRKCLLSPVLASVVGEDKMARHDVVKKMWSVVKERNLFDPSNKRYAICDEQLHKVFGTKRFLMFGMMKYLKNHITDVTDAKQ